MGDVPRVSVIMPAYNPGPWLAAAVESVRRQTLADLELIVVDDGSTDETPQLLASVAAEDSRVRVLRRPHEGLCAALNAGVAAARASLTARLDADDVAHETRLARQADHMDAHPGIGLLGSWAQEIDGAGRASGERRPPVDPDELERTLLKTNPMIHSSIMARTDLLRRLGGYRPAFEAAEDYDLWLRVAEAAQIANLPEPLVSYRVHQGSTTARRTLRMAFSARIARRAAMERRRTGSDPFAGLSHPPDWRETPADACYAEEAALYRWLDGDADPPAGAGAALLGDLTHAERRLVAQTFLARLASGNADAARSARRLLVRLCCERPSLVLRAAWSLRF